MSEVQQVTHGPVVPALLLTSEQAAQALAISPRKLWELTKAGEISAVRIGRSLRYAPSDLQAWVDQQRESRGNL